MLFSHGKGHMFILLDIDGLVHDGLSEIDIWRCCGNSSVSYTHLTLPTKRIV